jgi:hypothetical protein
MAIDDKTRTELEAAVFRRLVEHLRARRPAENSAAAPMMGSLNDSRRRKSASSPRKSFLLWARCG